MIRGAMLLAWDSPHAAISGMTTMTKIRPAALFLALAMPLAALASEPADRDPPEKAPSAMTPTEIAAYNKGLPSSHPYFIRCRKLLETGSLVKKARVCRTNEGWKQSFAQGNTNARDTVESMQQGAQNSN